MGYSVLIPANGTDYRLGDQYYVYFFTLREAAFCGALTFSYALRKLFICPMADPPLAVSVADWTRRRNGLR